MVEAGAFLHASKEVSAMSLLGRVAQKAVMARLGCLKEGRLTVQENGNTHVFGSGNTPSATVAIRDESFFRALAFGGHVGTVEAFMDGFWDVDDLTSLIRIFLRNREVLDGLETGWARLVQPARFILHALNRNTRGGSKRNIIAHYDLGNELFSQFLDETMTYSCGVFERPESSMREASIAKYDRLCQKLALTEDDHIVEIGTGWGGFAIHAASRYGCRVTTTTVSDQQYLLASERISAAGLDNRVTLLCCDYRDLTGSFDKLVSIEMIEAVGHQYYGLFFEQAAKLLKPHGLAAIQAITIQDRYYEAGRRETDFIKRYIFPGSCIPALSILMAAMAPTDLRLVHLEDITLHYAETLRRWRERFLTNWPAIEALGHGEQFRRLWQFYFSYCEGGFEESVLGDVQLIFAKPQAIPIAGGANPERAIA